tara:strand:- start:570 stop:833 length:264 start_codon:yes stop_codon:yes gene_type:complete
VYVIELALKLSPLSLSVQRKQKKDAEALYNKIKDCLDKGSPKLLELSCDQLVDKKITVLTNEILALQIYEKTASIGGSKRPGFSLND